ncbi:hypothetical protein [Hymenobacter terrestris]|uniref:Uncharacterized protein n=1 Tax=Hymenobacter terrestris TaxID=2748310 RepID=A0ABX2Q793_9BACT|nr:hypothetical protein [Hymenobacter terrestris]NVO85544.1 hypothetical protein [Hymenobacter terrestris]
MRRLLLPAVHIPPGTIPTMANQPNKQPENKQTDKSLKEGDPLFNLKHAEAESALAEKNDGLGPTTNVYMTEAEESNIDNGPRDSQGTRRGEQNPGREGSNAGTH